MIQATITLTRFQEPDWLVERTLDSLALQQKIRGEVVFLDQDWRPDFAARVESRSRGDWEFRCLKCPTKGLSYARNLALERATNDVVLFIDPDAIADPNWASELARALQPREVVIVGSRILPLWLGRAPILTYSRVVRDQYSLLDWGEGSLRVPRIVGVGFGVNRTRHPSEMHFDLNLGRRNGRLYGGEESNLCARIRTAGGGVMYVGAAVIHHQITADRLTWRWIWRRLYHAGFGRATIGGAPSPSQRPGLIDWLLLPLILPPYAVGYIYGRLRNHKR